MIPMRLERAVLHTGSSMISRQKRPSLILTFPNRSTYPARVPRVETIVAKSATWARVPLPARIVITPGSSRSTPRSAFQLEQLTRNSARRWKRSEEHTSELQSHSDLVCRLLLEKKKQKNQQ